MENNIAETYKEFWKVADELARIEVKNNEDVDIDEARSKHLVAMIEMFGILNGIGNDNM